MSIIKFPSTEFRIEDEYPSYSHMVCKRCGEVITPRYTEGDRQFIPGLSRCYIRDTEVTKEEFDYQVKLLLPSSD